jgi:iduronate 2-sulfatase
MVPLLVNPKRKWKEAAYSQYPRGGGVMEYTLRSGRWRYTEWIERGTGKVTARELYDHSAGPLSDRNVADDPKHSAEVRRLSSLLDKGQGWRRVRERLKA